VFNYLFDGVVLYVVFDVVVGCVVFVWKLDMYLVECVVCGYLIGFGFVEYCVGGVVCGVLLFEGLFDGLWLFELIFIFVMKVELGEYDENVIFE